MLLIPALAILASASGNFQGTAKWDSIMSQSPKPLSTMSFSERFEYFARSFVGTPYVAFTLEQDPGNEFCYVTLDGLDCVTYMETVFGLSRINYRMRRLPMPSDLLGKVQETRYRNGVVNGYLSRHHYTTEWMANNAKNGLVMDLTKSLPGAKPLVQKLDFMSTHYKSYPALAKNPGLLAELRSIESRISKLPKFYVPTAEVAKAEGKLKTGDIIGMVDTREGLDYAHVGVILVIDGVPHFCHASSGRQKVMIDDRLSKVMASVKNWKGFSVSRPIVAN